jgi:putative acetyltransferase
MVKPICAQTATWNGKTIMPELSITLAESPEDQAAVKGIFQAFIDFLPIQLDFQGIDDEMANFPATYKFMLVAKIDGTPIGAVALKEHSSKVCEMKRLYVLPAAQGHSAGRKLCERLLSEAKAKGYSKMLLDSLKRLEAAVTLYQKLGFVETEPYNFNPEDDVIYMEKAL